MTQRSSFLNIAIIGGGPAGCTLGRLLHLHSIRFTIFEGEASPDARSQGGTLDLHNDTGLAALKAAGLYDDFLKAFVLADKKLKRYINVGGTNVGSSRGRPEIDRCELRRILYGSLPEGVIRWGYRLRSVGEDMSLHFDQGVETGFDLIVGADGAWSKVRLLVSDELPGYSGISGLEMRVHDIAERYPDLNKLVNRGSFFSFSDGHSIMAQQLGDGSLRVADWAVRSEVWTSQHDIHIQGVASVMDEVLSEYKSWAPEIRKLLEVADHGDAISRALYMLPVGFRFKNRPGMTLIGDAAHVTVPFAGEGVNLAMVDSMKLSEVIKSTSKEDLYTNVAAFEQDMFVRATKIQEVSVANMKDMYFTPGAPRSTIESWISRVLRKAYPGVLGVLGTALVYAYYWVFKIFI